VIVEASSDRRKSSSAPLRFISGAGLGLLVGWGLGAFLIVPPGGWTQWALCVFGLALLLVPAYLLSRS
jgi:hypothetical protein